MAAMWCRLSQGWGRLTGISMPEGTIVGLTRGVNKCHIIRATLELWLIRSMNVTEAMRADSGIQMNSLKVDGGASAQ